VGEVEENKFRRLIAQRKFRDIATELVRLEDARGAVSMKALGESPEEAVSESNELELEFTTSPHAGCSVFGYYKYRPNQTSIIFVHPSNTLARDNFTIAHEYGHHVQRQHEAWANVLYSLQARERQFVDERTADAFAAAVLIPAELVTPESAWLTSRTIASVHENVLASRSAVAARILEIASPDDFATVIVCGSDGTVIFARTNGDEVFTPARGVVQTGLATLFSSAQSADGHAQRELSDGLKASSGWVQDDVVGDLSIDHTGEYAFVVLRSAQKFGRKPKWSTSEIECSSLACESVFKVDESIEFCAECHEPKCPNCSSCACEPQLTSTCLNCFVQLSVAEQSGVIEHVC